MNAHEVLSQARAGGRLAVIDRGPVREIRLHRPEVHNALDAELIGALTAAFEEITLAVEPAADSGALPSSGGEDIRPGSDFEPPRAILLSGAGRSFCAGADLQYMREVAAFSEEENRADALRLAALFAAIRRCPVFVLARVQGAALGGGCGLVAASDLVVAAAGARFGFTEVRLGIVPATISPYVIERIGAARARALFPTGEIFDAHEARRIGLVDRVAPDEELDGAMGRILGALLSAAPGASREAKALADRIAAASSIPLDPALAAETAGWIARLRASDEGREGIAAFLEKRPARWVQSLDEIGWLDRPEPPRSGSPRGDAA